MLLETLISEACQRGYLKPEEEIDGDKAVWLDVAHNGPEVEHISYIIKWEAIIRDGKIQSLSGMPRYLAEALHSHRD